MPSSRCSVLAVLCFHAAVCQLCAQGPDKPRQVAKRPPVAARLIVNQSTYVLPSDRHGEAFRKRIVAETDSENLPEDAVDRDQMLTNVTLYWLTETARSSADLYREDGSEWGMVEVSHVPTGLALFPAEVGQPIRRWAEKENTNIIHWSEFDRGGHFAAMEEPDLLVGDIREFFRLVR